MYFVISSSYISCVIGGVTLGFVVHMIFVLLLLRNIDEKSQFRWNAFNFCYVWVTSLAQKLVLCKITTGNITVHEKSEVFSGKIHGVRWPLSLIPSKFKNFVFSLLSPKSWTKYSYLIFFSNFTCSLELIKEPCPLIYTNDLSYPGAHAPCSFSYKHVWTSKTLMTFLTWKAAIPRYTSRK